MDYRELQLPITPYRPGPMCLGEQILKASRSPVSLVVLSILCLIAGLWQEARTKAKIKLLPDAVILIRMIKGYPARLHPT